MSGKLPSLSRRLTKLEPQLADGARRAKLTAKAQDRKAISTRLLPESACQRIFAVLLNRQFRTLAHRPTCKSGLELMPSYYCFQNTWKIPNRVV
jgi:hypothetical protein